MFDADEQISDYQKVIRELASQSLGPLRYAFNSPVKSPGSRKYKGDSYSSAVTRLKTLLQQYNDSQILEPRAAATSQSIGTVPDRSHLPNTDEVTQLLNNQFTVLQYLEGQVEFYKDALESLKQRAELVITENENLFDQLKTQAISQVLSTGEQSKPEEQFPSGPTSGDPKQRLGRLQTEDSTISGDGDDDEERQEQGTMPAVLHEHSKAQPVRGLKKMDRETMSTKELGLHDIVPSERDPRRSLMPSVMQRSALESSFGISNLDSQLFMSANERKFVNQLEEEVEKIRKLHEAKTRHLESLLYSTRDELEDYQRQLSELQAKLRAQKVLEDQRGQPALCVKCGHHSAVLSNTHSEAAIDTINQLTKERDDLMNMLTGQKAILAEVRQREFEAYNQVKKSCNMVEQAQLEKAEAIIHVRQLREDLRKERERHENSMRMFSEKMDMERKKVQEACREEVSGLVKQAKRPEHRKRSHKHRGGFKISLSLAIESLREARSALENQLERLIHEKVDLMAELEQANSQILANASEISKANETVEKELEQTQMRLSTASQELHSVKATAQQAQREREQERTRLTSEMDELRRRLQEAEHSWMECKEDCIRFTERLNNAEREAKGAIAAKEKLEKTRAEDFEQLRKQSGQRDEQLTTLLQETETRHTQCRTELQQMFEAEIHVCNKMKEECKRLTQQLEDSAEKSSAKVQDANKECSKLKKKLDESVTRRRTLEEQNTKKDKRIHELQSRLKQNDENTRKQVDQMCQLLSTRNNLMKERKILSQEVEFLRKQLIAKIPSEPVTPFMETASNSSAEDPGRMTEENQRDA